MVFLSNIFSYISPSTLCGPRIRQFSFYTTVHNYTDVKILQPLRNVVFLITSVGLSFVVLT